MARARSCGVAAFGIKYGVFCDICRFFHPHTHFRRGRPIHRARQTADASPAVGSTHVGTRLWVCGMNTSPVTKWNPSRENVIPLSNDRLLCCHSDEVRVSGARRSCRRPPPG